MIKGKMKTLFIQFSVIICLTFIIILFLNRKSFKNFEVQKITIYSIEYQKENFFLLDNYQELLKNQKIMKIIDNPKTINEIKKIILAGKRGSFDYVFYNNDTLKPIDIPSMPNYLLEMIDSSNNRIYVFMWLYDNQESAFITYFYDNNLNTLNRDKMKNLVINENDTKSLKRLFLSFFND